MQIHVVQEGESVYSVSNMYSIKMHDLIKANHLKEPAKLEDGQAIIIPINGEYYFVKEGEDIDSIAARFGYSAQELSKINEFPIGDYLPVGFRLYIPSQFE